jgi:hypothetical protein
MKALIFSEPLTTPLSVSIDCSHVNIKVTDLYENRMKISSIFDQLHPPQPNIKKGTVFECEGSKELGAHLHTYLNENLTVSHLSQLNIKSLKFKCRIPDLKQLEVLVENTTKETVNSFEILNSVVRILFIRH